ncbi:MAG: carbohydrate ABC transporter permease [Ruminococcaceae bacterium]|nr:carbohydrate ABC transporter permease [Oscillospiraceae bacterium]
MKASHKRILKKIFSNKAKKVNRSKTGNLFIFIVLLVFGLYSALPLILAVLQSIKPLNELFLYPPRFWVESPTVDNYFSLVDLMTTSWVPFSRYTFNTILISVVGTVGHIIIAAMCAYPLAKNKVPGEKIIFGIIVYSLMIQPTVADIANYQTMASLNFLDSYWAVIIPAFGSSLGLYIMKNFISVLPDSILEAARIDGAGEFKIFWRIVMPNAKPGWLTLAIFSFQGLWNGTNSTYIYSEELKTLPYALNQIIAGGITRAGAGAAVAVVMMIVPIIFFILTQSNIMETMASSGMKD